MMGEHQAVMEVRRLKKLRIRVAFPVFRISVMCLTI